MPTLEWIGKEKVINHDKEVPFKLLDAQYTFDEKGKREGEADSSNKIIHGDNLLALKALLPKYQEKIKCRSVLAAAYFFAETVSPSARPLSVP